MKQLYFLFILLLIARLTTAQAVQTDLLYKLDGKPLSVRIGGMTTQHVLYYEPSRPKVRRSIPRSQVWKVVYASGREFEINKRPVMETITPRSAVEPIKTSAVALVIPQEQYQVTPAVSQTASPTVQTVTSQPIIGSRPDFYKLQITLGPEMTFFPKLLNQDASWISDSTGYGMKMNLGVSIRGDYRFHRNFAGSFTVGYAGWELVRSYMREEVNEFQESVRLTRIPIQIGLKVNITPNWYIMPEGGVNLLFSSLKSLDQQAIEAVPVKFTSTAFPVTFGGSVGYEIRKGGFLVDLGLRYQLLNIKKLQNVNLGGEMNEKLNMISLRVGLGFVALPK